jgi:acyl-coenzyme A thioesterase PaaI-like protein
VADDLGPTAPAGRPWSGGGREELADAVRRLIAVTVTSHASPEQIADAAARAGGLADELERQVPAPGPTPTPRFSDRSVAPDAVASLASFMPFDVIAGSCNPLALPLTIEFEPPKAICRAVFTAPYEGAPGMVHGAVLAGTFDIVLTAANVVAGGPGPTVSLAIRYLKPSLIGIPSLFEGWVTSLDERRTYSRGHLIQDGVVTVEAEGEFVNMDRSKINTLHRRPGGVQPVAPGS